MRCIHRHSSHINHANYYTSHKKQHFRLSSGIIKTIQPTQPQLDMLMSEIKRKSAAPVLYVESMSEDGFIRQFPDDLDMKKMFSNRTLHIFNPLKPGLPLREVPTQSIRYKDLRDGFIVFPHETLSIVHERGLDVTSKIEKLAFMADDFFDGVAIPLYIRQLSMPKRDGAKTPSIDQDAMGLIVSPPKRKIEAPKLGVKPTMRNSWQSKGGRS